MFEPTVAQYGRILFGILRDVVQEASGGEFPAKPFHFAKATGLQKDIISRLFTGFRTTDQFEALHYLPGTQALQNMVEVCALKGTTPSTAERASKALAEFDTVVLREFGSRSGLEAYVAARLPKARRAQQLTSKQAMYRGAVGLKGVTSDVIYVLFVCAPNPDDPRVGDTMVINGFAGLHRVRPGAIVQFSTAEIKMTADNRPSPTHTRPPSELIELPELCLPEPMPFVVTRSRGMVHHQLKDKGVGPLTSCTYCSGELSRRIRLLESSRPDMWPQYFCATIDHPTKLLIFDILVHKDMWPGTESYLRIYDTALYGLPDARDPNRDKDVLDLDESIEPLAGPPSSWGTPEFPPCSRAQAAAIGLLSYPAHEYRACRVRSVYPPYGSMFTICYKSSV